MVVKSLNIKKNASLNIETFFFATPFVFLPIVIYYAALGQINPWSFETTGWLNFLVGIIFLNTIHVLFTLRLFFFLPELQLLKRKYSKTKPISFQIETFIFFVICFALLQLISSPFESTAAIKIYSITVVMLSFWHSLRQTAGISSLFWYSKKLNISMLPDSKRNQYISNERRSFHVIYFVFVLHSLLMIIPEQKIPYIEQITLSFFAAAVSLICVSVIIKGSLQSGQKWWSPKTLYLSRIFYIPLMYISMPAALSLMAFHGIDYYFICREMLNKSRNKNDKRGQLFLLISIPTTILILLTMPYGSGLGWWILSPKNFEEYPILTWLASFGGALTITHYYLDWKIFRFRDQLQRDYISPLLNSFMSSNN